MRGAKIDSDSSLCTAIVQSLEHLPRGVPLIALVHYLSILHTTRAFVDNPNRGQTWHRAVSRDGYVRCCVMFLELNQSLYYLIGNSIIRLVVIDELTERTVSKIRSMRPSPSYYAIYSSTPKMAEFFKTVSVYISLFGNIILKRNNFSHIRKYRYTNYSEVWITFFRLLREAWLKERVFGTWYLRTIIIKNFHILPETLSWTSHLPSWLWRSTSVVVWWARHLVIVPRISRFVSTK